MTNKEKCPYCGGELNQVKIFSGSFDAMEDVVYTDEFVCNDCERVMKEKDIIELWREAESIAREKAFRDESIDLYEFYTN